MVTQSDESGDGTYQCVVCGETFDTEAGFETHNQRAHDGDDQLRASANVMAQSIAHRVAEADTDYSKEFAIELPHSTWLTIYHALSVAVREEDVEELADEFDEAKEEFLLAHPEEMTP